MDLGFNEVNVVVVVCFVKYSTHIKDYRDILVVIIKYINNFYNFDLPHGLRICERQNDNNIFV